MPMTTTPSSETCMPRWGTPRSPDRETRGGRIARAAELAGWDLMPWQRMVANVAGELDESGLPAYRELTVTVPRQSGKTVIQFAIAVDRCINWPTPQRVVYTAQTGWDARRKMLDDVAPVLLRSQVAPAIAKVTRGAGNESVIFRNGSRIDVMASNEEAGHGRTLDLAIIDEAFADTDMRREQAVLPAMATRPEAQVLIFSTAGTQSSVLLARKVELGRAAVRAGSRVGTAYFEWSADDAADIDDPATWYSCMPALGHTISEGVVRHARSTMQEGEFRRAYCNQWTETEERVIPAEAWRAVCVHGAQADPRKARFAIDARSDRTASCITVSDGETVELVGTGKGVAWVADWFAADESRRAREVVVDGRGPVANVADDLERSGCKVRRVDTTQVSKACASFFDAVADMKVTVRADEMLDKAASQAVRRASGDSWRWHRDYFGGDILTALSLAFQTELSPDPLTQIW